MKVIKKDSTYPIDVDDTLITDAKEGEEGAIQMNYYGEIVWKKPYKPHIQLLKASLTRGRNVIVWSGNGFAWAAEVLEKLGLDRYPILVMSKPAGYVDDLNCEKWMGNRVYIKEKSQMWKNFLDTMQKVCYTMSRIKEYLWK